MIRTFTLVLEVLVETLVDLADDDELEVFSDALSVACEVFSEAWSAVPETESRSLPKKPLPCSFVSCAVSFTFCLASSPPSGVYSA